MEKVTYATFDKNSKVLFREAKSGEKFYKYQVKIGDRVVDAVASEYIDIPNNIKLEITCFPRSRIIDNKIYTYLYVYKAVNINNDIKLDNQYVFKVKGILDKKVDTFVTNNSEGIKFSIYYYGENNQKQIVRFKAYGNNARKLLAIPIGTELECMGTISNKRSYLGFNVKSFTVTKQIYYQYERGYEIQAQS